MQPINDFELAARLKKEDQQVFKILFDKYYTQLTYFAVKLISEREEAEDIVLTSFSKFWQLRSNFETENNIKAFLYITVRNNCYNYIKFRKRRDEKEKELRAVLPVAGDEKFLHWEESLVEAAVLDSILKAIQQLPKQSRRVFELTYLKGLSSREVAHQMGITISTVTTQRVRAIEHLRKLLPKEHFLLLCILLSVHNGHS